MPARCPCHHMLAVAHRDPVEAVEDGSQSLDSGRLSRDQANVRVDAFPADSARRSLYDATIKAYLRRRRQSTKQGPANYAAYARDSTLVPQRLGRTTS